MQATNERIEQLVKEGPIGPTEAAKYFGRLRGGAPVRRSTVIRWMLDGIAIPIGQRINLEHFRLGNRLMTTRAACMRFIVAQQGQPKPAEAATELVKARDKKSRGKGPRRSAARSAGSALEAIGA